MYWDVERILIYHQYIPVRYKIINMFTSTMALATCWYHQHIQHLTQRSLYWTRRSDETQTKLRGIKHIKECETHTTFSLTPLELKFLCRWNTESEERYVNFGLQNLLWMIIVVFFCTDHLLVVFICTRNDSTKRTSTLIISVGLQLW